MAISNMQQSRQLRAGGGIMDLKPRQGYFLGKLVKKAGRGLKKVLKSPLGLAAVGTGLNMFGVPGTGGFGKGFLTGKNKGLLTRLRSGEGAFGKFGNMFRKDSSNPDSAFSMGKLGLGALGLAAVTAPYLQRPDEEIEEEESFSITPGSISDIRSMARMRDPSLAFMPQSRYTQKNYYAANGGIARLANGGGAGQQQMMQALQAEYMKYRQNGGTMPFEQYAKMVMQQGQTQVAANGGRMGYAEAGSVRKDPYDIVEGMDNELNPGLLDKILSSFGVGKFTYGVDQDKGASLIDEIQDYKYGESYPGKTISGGKDKYGAVIGSIPKPDRLPMSREETIEALEDRWDQAVEDDYGFLDFENMGIYKKGDIERRINLGFDQAKTLNNSNRIMAAQGGRIGYANAGPVMNQEVVNEDTQEVVSNPDPIAELNMLSMEVFGKPYDRLNEREQEALKEFMSKNPEEEIINRDETMVEDRVMANSGGMIDYMSSANPMARSYLMEDTDIVNMYRPGGDRQMAAEGGIMDLGGMEKDYRAEGGFVPIGGQEKADDVPARLSKNEFVFTADAVRNAGGGDIDAGAEVMENMMNHLEQGGQVSEESQGGNPAQEMFNTAQQLESRIA